ncbi:MAG: YafY family transcriptional regulator [Anaerolineales bacterium]|nr:MAG: YafY family transcriptional regulator [Anaerolineales bacterium]
MRADRLISMLLLLQIHGKLSAEQLAKRLEVSTRTVYRDMEALSTAGVPVYAERGPGGGIALLESYRTSLTGLNSREVRALFMLSTLSPLDQLGADQELKSAFLKLAAALPASLRMDEQQARQRIYLDWKPWSHREESTAHLQTIQQAVFQSRWLSVRYMPMGAPWIEPLENLVQPYGLVAKESSWYLVCKCRALMRVIRVVDILEVFQLAKGFIRKNDFDLERFWAAWCQEYAADHPRYLVKALVSPSIHPALQRYFQEHHSEQITINTSSENGWYVVELPFSTLEEARQRILGYGGSIEVIEPVALRYSVADYAQQILKRY